MNPPIYVMSAFLETTNEIVDFTSIGKGRAAQLLVNPGQIRNHGWDLQTGDKPRLINGEFLEVKYGNRKTIRLYKDGTLIAKILINPELCWPRDEAEFNLKPRINSLGLIEMTYNFFSFYREIIPLLKNGNDISINFRFDLKNLKIDSNFVYLCAGSVKSFGWRDDYPKYSSTQEKISVEITSLLANDFLNRADFLCYDVVKMIYANFGMNEELIPYTNVNSKNEGFIDKKRFSE